MRFPSRIPASCIPVHDVFDRNISRLFACPASRLLVFL